MTTGLAKEALLRRAIELALTAQQSGNPPYGSLLADSAGIIAEETTLRTRMMTSPPISS